MATMKNPFDITSQVVVVTGATGVLAGAVARHLGENGALVAIIGRHPDKMVKTVAEIEKLGGTAACFTADVLDEAAIEQASKDIVAKFGRVDALVNGAGGNMPGATIPPDKTIFDLKMDDYCKVLDLNLKGTLIPTMTFSKIMAKEGRGSIVNFSSMTATRMITRVVGYSNAKAAIDNLTEWLAMEFAHHYGDKIRVNAVAPGFFLGEQNRAMLVNPDGTYTERGNKVVRQTPMGRFGDASEVPGAVHFLISPAARFVTGEIIRIDGGFSIFGGV
jgi:NAD(P)-dependent dehydrogenase (short-subunit alcohol dehydrogenase family)